MSRPVQSWLPAALLLLLISCSVNGQLTDVTNSSLVSALFLNHLEHALERITALSEVANLFTGGVAGLTG